jgi:hypothetical protein
MRCDRCDRIITREHLARTRDGVLVFGWCAGCLAEEGCELIDGPAAPLSLSTRPSARSRFRHVIRRVRRLRRLRNAGGRRLAWVGITGLLAAWALILAFVSGVKLPHAARHGAPADVKSAFLLAGSGVLALMSLGLWIALIARDRRLRVGLKVIQVAATIVAFGTLVWAIFRHVPAQDPVIIGIVFAAIAISWAARRFERQRPGSQRQTTSAAS